MNNLYLAWGLTHLFGIVFLTMDVVFLPLFEIKGIPTFSVIGAALILMGFSSILNWIFKIAWAERGEGADFSSS